MAVFGLSVHNSAGKLVYDSSKVTWNQINTFRGTDTGVSYSFPGKEMLAMYFFVNAPSVTAATYLPNISYDNYSLSVSQRSDGLAQEIAGLVLMR